MKSHLRHSPTVLDDWAQKGFLDVSVRIVTSLCLGWFSVHRNKKPLCKRGRLRRCAKDLMQSYTFHKKHGFQWHSWITFPADSWILRFLMRSQLLRYFATFAGYWEHFSPLILPSQILYKFTRYFFRFIFPMCSAMYIFRSFFYFNHLAGIFLFFSFTYSLSSQAISF